MTRDEHRANALWGSGKVDAPPCSTRSTGVRWAAVGRRGGGGMLLRFENSATPHTLTSRIGDWRRRFGEHPGVMLMASLVSEHDEVLWLVTNDRRSPSRASWWRSPPGAPVAARSGRLDVLIPATSGSRRQCAARGFTDAGPARSAAARPRRAFGCFARAWPGATLAQLDVAALSSEPRGSNPGRWNLARIAGEALARWSADCKDGVETVLDELGCACRPAPSAPATSARPCRRRPRRSCPTP